MPTEPRLAAVYLLGGLAALRQVPSGRHEELAVDAVDVHTWSILEPMRYSGKTVGGRSGS